MKGGVLCLAYIFLFLKCYSQSDSKPVVAGDSMVKNDWEAIQQNNSGTKKAPYKKESIYFIKRSVDIPIVIVNSAFSIYGLSKIYIKAPSTEAQINSLNTSDINSFDRGAVYPYSNSLHVISSYEFYAAIPLPFILFLVTDETRQEYGKLSFLYWEVLSFTGLFGTGAPYFIDRYRPYTYTSETPMEKRIMPVAKNSAFSGHTEIVAASTFFIAKVYSDYNPGKKIMLFSMASVLTGSMAYLRVMGGEHFPSDVLVGAAIGTLSGILVPHFHKHKLIKNPDLSIVPFNNDEARGLTLTYRLR